MVQKNYRDSGIKPGQWVSGFRCSKCKAPIVLLNRIEDLPDPISLKCPKCGHEDHYALARIERFQAQAKQ